MTKQAVIAIVVGVFIILAAGGAFLYSQSKPSNESKNLTTAAKVSETPENKGIQSSIKEILASGKTSKCTFTMQANEGQTTGTIYTSEENARGDFETTTNGKDSTTHMIKTGETFYMWTDSIPMGIKMVMSVDELSSKLDGNESFGALNPDQEMEIDCVSWTEDRALFNPPTKVKFTSFDSMIPGASSRTSVAPTSTSSNKTENINECNICNSLTGQAKSACIAQFNCN